MSAEILGEPSHPGRAADRVVLAEQGPIAVEHLIEFRLAPAETGGVLGASFARRQLGQAFQGRHPARIGRDGLLEGLPLRGGVAPSGGEPGSQLVDPRRGKSSAVR